MNNGRFPLLSDALKAAKWPRDEKKEYQPAPLASDIRSFLINAPPLAVAFVPTAQ